MKTLFLYQIALPAIFLLASLSTLQAQKKISPCLCIDVETLDCNTTGRLDPTRARIIDGNAVTLHISDDPRTLDTPSIRARYKAFWIPGDGNFIHEPRQDSLSDVRTNTLKYVYHKKGDFEPVASLTEKKSNDDPPKSTKRKVTVNRLSNPTGTPFTKRLQGTSKSADILNSEKLRMKYPTAFAVSSHKTPKDVLVYFFYNNQLQEGRPVRRDSILLLETVHQPNYQFDAYTSGRTADITSFAELLQLQGMYNNYIEVKISQRALDSMAAGFDEFRFFPILKTISADTLPICRFAVVVVGTQIPTDTDDPFYEIKRVEDLQGVLRNLFPDTSSVSNTFRLTSNADQGFIFNQGILQNPPTYYVTGAYTVDVPILASIDPNSITVKSICPDGADKYKVTARLEVCNQGYVDENTIPVRLKDLQGHFSEFTVLDKGASITFEEKTDFSQWKFTWSAHLDPIPHPSDPPGSFDELDFEKQCDHFDFTIKTNWEGVQQLVAGKGLELCVTFLNATSLREECTNNTPVDGTQEASLKQSGYNCGDPGTGGSSCDIWCILAIILGVFFAFWWWWRSRRE